MNSSSDESPAAVKAASQTLSRFASLAASVSRSPYAFVCIDRDGECDSATAGRVPVSSSVFAALCSELLRSNESIVVADTSSDARLAALSERGIRSLAISRLSIAPAGSRCGYVAVMDHSPNRYDEASQRILGSVSEHVSASFDATSSPGQQRFHSLVADFAVRAVQRSEIDVLLSDATCLVRRGLGASLAVLMELGTHGDRFDVRIADGDAASSVRGVSVSRSAKFISGAAIDSLMPIFVDDWESENRFAPSTVVEAADARSSIAMPLVVGDVPFGVMSVHDPQPGRFGTDEVDFLQNVGKLLAASIERRRADELEQRRVRQFEAIHQLSQLLARANDLQEVYDAALLAIESVLKADRSAILLFDAHGFLDFAASRGLSAEYRAAVRGHSPWNRETKNPLPVVVADPDLEPSLTHLAGAIRSEGIASLAFFPLAVGDELLGKLMLYNNTHRVMTENEIRIGDTLARQIAVAMRRKGHEVDLRRAKEQLEIILAGVADAITVQSPDGRLIFANRAAAENLGFSAVGDLVAHDTSSILSRYAIFDESGNAMPADTLPGRRAIAERRPVTATIRFRDRERTHDERWSVIRSAPVFDDKGAPLLAINIFRDVTDEKRAETERATLLAKIEQERARLVAVIDQMPAGVIIAEAPSGKLVLGNRQIEEIFKRPMPKSSSVEDYDEWEAYHLDGQRYGAEEFPMARAIRNGESIRNEEMIVACGDGSRRVAEVSAEPIRDRGSILGGVVTIVDVTERRRAEDAKEFLAAAGAILASSLDYETTLRSVASLLVPRIADWCAIDMKTPDGRSRRIAVLHQDPEKIDLAHRLEADYPIDYDAPRGLPYVLRSGKPDLIREITDAMLVATARDERHLAMLREVGIRSGMVVPMMSRDRVLGAITFVSSREDRRYDEIDVELGMELGRRAAMAVDNAELYAAQENARRSAERTADRIAALQQITSQLSKALTPSDVAEVVLSGSRTVLDAAGGFFAVLRDDKLEVLRFEGYPVHILDRFTTIPLSMRTPATDVVRTLEPLWIESIEERRRLYPEFADVASGNEAHVAIPMVVHGIPAGAIVMAFRAPKPFSREVRDFMVAIAQQASQALERVRLYEAEREARKVAQQASRAKDEFLATLSHELRTPMTAILGWARMLQLGTLEPAAQQSAIDTIERSAKAQAKMVEEILDVSRVITGKLRLDVAKLDFAPVVADAVETLRPTAETKNIAIAVYVEPTEIVGDRDRLQQAVWNILANALKFTPRGGRISVELRRGTTDAVLTITDTGIGMPRDFLPHAFERFRQADATTTRIHGGLGLGLAIVRHLTELHGGTVRADSEGEHQGSTFTITLPLATQDEEQIVTGRTSLVTGSRLAGIRLLVVDDVDDNSRLLSTIVQAEGAEAATVDCVSDAFMKLSEWRPHAVITDIAMPGEDGWSLVEKLRNSADEDLRRMTCVALTAYGRPEDRARAIEAGFDDFLQKPVDPESLTTALLGALRSRQM